MCVRVCTPMPVPMAIPMPVAIHGLVYAHVTAHVTAALRLRLARPLPQLSYTHLPRCGMVGSCVHCRSGAVELVVVFCAFEVVA